MSRHSAGTSPPLQKLPRPAKAKPTNPIESAIILWHSTLPPDLLTSLNLTLSHLISSAPKRWVVYPPMVLLPSGSFGSERSAPLILISPSYIIYEDRLWQYILSSLSKREGKGQLTHLAINSGIPLLQKSASESPTLSPEGHGNILRTPTGLITLYGNFGPSLSPMTPPSPKDFQEAFWVSTKQNGIYQVWAPRYTMFSRGNIKEKARLLSFHEQEGKEMSADEMGVKTAVDLYAGIGYFVFSYRKLGMSVMGWELNPWSVEGLRRGAELNGWKVRVVKEGEKVEFGGEKMVIVQGDNTKARKRLNSVDLGEVLHVNCGLLPTSTDTWETALSLVKVEGWLHLHENVGTDDIPGRRTEIEEAFQRWLREAGDDRVALIEHVELVKTFAPGVWHCVFDLHLHHSLNPW